MSKRTKKCAI